MKKNEQNPRVLFRHEEGIAIVTLNRPDKHNGFDLQMMEALFGVARRLRKDKSIRAVVIHGEGPSFCAGLDFAGVMNKPIRIVRHFFRPFWRTTNNFQEVVWMWRRLRVPVIAAIHGNCFGAGIQIALGADIRFASPTAKLSVMEIKWGLIPDMAGTKLLNEVVALDVAKDLTMTGRLVEGEEAKTLGLVTRVSGDPLADAIAYAKGLAEKSPDGLYVAKMLLSKNRTASPWLAFLRERVYQLRILLSKNQRIAMRAVAMKEKPKFLKRW